MRQDIDSPTTPDDSQQPYSTRGIEEVLGLIADRWLGWFSDRLAECPKGTKMSTWERQYRDLCSRYGVGRVFEALNRVATVWDRSDRPPLAHEVQDYWFEPVPPALAKHLHLPWREAPAEPDRGTPEERGKFLADWKKAMAASPADALGDYQRAVSGGFTGSMREYWQ